MLTIHWIGHVASCQEDINDRFLKQGFKGSAESFIEICDMIDEIKSTKTRYCKQCKVNAQSPTGEK